MSSRSGRAALWIALVWVALGCDPPEPRPDASGSDASAGADAGPGTADAGAVCASDADCDDGAFCNGVERCAPEDPAAAAGGCLPGEDPCAGDDGVCDETQDACVTSCEDGDGDGHPGISCGGDDCDDADPDRYPGNVEVCDAAGHDEDCDPSTFGADRDGDDVVALDCCQQAADGALQCGTDCNDDNAEVNPSATEVCNGVDEDCDAQIDEGTLVTFYPDTDNDGFGDPEGPTTQACSVPPGYSANSTDCDDRDAARNPGLTEVCDGKDNDCDGRLDAPNEDDDGDGYADTCAGLPSWLEDCDDTDAGRHPNADELCNGIDDDCNGLTPGEDEDGDSQAATDAPCTGGTLPRTDCNDGDASVYEGAAETCNGVDDDCDATIDGATADAACSLPEATSVCVDGSCAVEECLGTRLNCDGVAANGCEVEGDSNDAFCGSCELACSPAEYCSGAVCDTYLSWAGRFGGDDFDEPTALAVDASGNLYVAGWFRTPSVTIGTTTLTNAGPCDGAGRCSEDILVFSLTSGGAVRWARSFGDADTDEARAIAIDGDRLLVGGRFTGTLAMGGTAGSVSSTGELDAFVTALAPATGEASWVTAIGGTGSESLHGVALDASGNAYAAGDYRSGSVTLGSSTLTNTLLPTGHYSSNLFVARLAAADGAPDWAIGVGGDRGESASSVAVDGSAVYVTGGFGSESITFGSETLTNTGIGDIFVARLATADGATAWATSFTGPSSGSEIGGAITAAAGQVFVTGDHYQGLTVGTIALPSSGASDGFVAALDAADGAAQWATQVGGGGYDSVTSVAPSGSGALWVTGSSSSLPLEAGGVSFDTSGTDAVLLRLATSDGTVEWGRAFGGTGYDAGRGVAVDGAGDVSLTGVTRSSSFRIGGTILSGGTDSDVFVASIFVE